MVVADSVAVADLSMKTRLKHVPSPDSQPPPVGTFDLGLRVAVAYGEGWLVVLAHRLLAFEAFMVLLLLLRGHLLIRRPASEKSEERNTKITVENESIVEFVIIGISSILFDEDGEDTIRANEVWVR